MKLCSALYTSSGLCQERHASPGRARFEKSPSRCAHFVLWDARRDSGDRHYGLSKVCSEADLNDNVVSRNKQQFPHPSPCILLPLSLGPCQLWECRQPPSQECNFSFKLNHKL